MKAGARCMGSGCSEKIGNRFSIQTNIRKTVVAQAMILDMKNRIDLLRKNLFKE